MLDLGDVLPHVVAHLRPGGLQHLRSTCRALRFHACLLAAVRQVHYDCEEADVPDPAQLALLRRLPSISTLCIEGASTVFWTASLSGQQLTRVEILAPEDKLDVAPLASCSALQSLRLYAAEEPRHIQLLTSLTELELACTTLTEPHGRLSLLTSLQRLCADSHDHLTACSQSLHGLTHVSLDSRLGTALPWVQVLQHLAQLPALCSLALEVTAGEPALQCSGFSQLSRLTALFLGLQGSVMPRVDLRSVPGIRALGVQLDHKPFVQESSPKLTLKAPSISYLQVLAWAGTPKMANLTACHGLSQLVIALRGGNILLDHQLHWSFCWHSWL